ncbi:MAG: T9SS type A sorting domain-containing protein [Salinivirgaceae bacterium]|nr:T9SS type A sorting domain-containing protein [Salinivirgaceae bacterium]
MKKSILFISAILLAISSFSQDIAFVDEEGNLFPDELEIIGDTNQMTIDSSLTINGFIKNFTASAINISIKREIVDGQYVDDSIYLDPFNIDYWKWYFPEDQLCWGMCINYGIDDEVITSGVYAIEANAELDLHGIIHYKPYKFAGTTVLKYTILNGETVEHELTVTYSIGGATSILNKKVDKRKLNIYPNPILNTVNIENLDNVKSLSIVNMLGQKIYTRSDVGSKLSLNTSDLKTGVYFITVVTNDNKVITERVMKR